MTPGATVPLVNAHLCCDCSVITDNHRACPACASAHLLPLAVVLNRRVERVEQQSDEERIRLS